jgi:hypothetical protein
MGDFADFISDAISENGWTPDVPHLDTQDHWHVFVYNKRRGKSSGYFTHENSNAEFVSIGWTNSKIYSILNVQDGKTEYDLAVPHGTDQILGEVWKIPTEKLLSLDGDERNLLITNRIMVPVNYGGGLTIPCWAYLANPKYLLTGGITVSKYTGLTYYGNQKFVELH